MVAAALVALAARSPGEDNFLRQSPGVGHPDDIDRWRAGERRGELKAYPPAPPGTPNPAGGLPQFGGSARTSFGSPDLGMPFAEWKAKMERQRPAVDRAAHEI